MRRRLIKAFPGYSVTDDGLVWSKWRLRRRKIGLGNEAYLSDQWRKLKPKFVRGYPTVTLYRDHVAHYRAVHRLVLETFVGSCPVGMESRHLDGNPRNAALANLCWGTHQENVQDQIRHGTFQRIIDAAAKVNRGRKLSDEVKARIGAAHRGKVVTDETKDRMKANHWSNRPDAAEIIERSASKHRGKKHSEEHKRKIAEAGRRRWAAKRRAEAEES